MTAELQSTLCNGKPTCTVTSCFDRIVLITLNTFTLNLIILPTAITKHNKRQQTTSPLLLTETATTTGTGTTDNNTNNKSHRRHHDDKHNNNNDDRQSKYESNKLSPIIKDVIV